MVRYVCMSADFWACDSRSSATMASVSLVATTTPSSTDSQPIRRNSESGETPSPRAMAVSTAGDGC
jgi:hypothetical protein